jgi:hypothetical protein
VELDALPPNELRRRIKEAVEELIDQDAWSRALVVEQAEKESISDIVTRLQMGRNGNGTGKEKARAKRHEP